jgi:hypothetical protein
MLVVTLGMVRAQAVIVSAYRFMSRDKSLEWGRTRFSVNANENDSQLPNVPSSSDPFTRCTIGCEPSRIKGLRT